MLFPSTEKRSSAKGIFVDGPGSEGALDGFIANASGICAVFPGIENGGGCEVSGGGEGVRCVVFSFPAVEADGTCAVSLKIACAGGANGKWGVEGRVK